MVKYGIMILSAYLQEHGLTHTAFAHRIGVSIEAARRYAHGLRHPRPGIMRRIVAATDGQVGPQDFLDATDSDGEAA